MNNLDQPIDHKEVASQGARVSNVAKDDFGLDIPTELVPLPSKGIIYPESSSLHKREALEIRPMTAKEEDILMSRALIKNGTVITRLIESCLIDKTVDVESLVSGDRNALMVALRITGYGSEYNIEMPCPECGVTTKASFNLGDMPIKNLEVMPTEIGSNAFEILLPITKKNVIVKFLDGHDEREMTIIADRRKKSGLKMHTTVTDRLARSIISVDGITDKNKIGFFVKNIPVRDSLALRLFLENQEPGVEMTGHMTCDACYEESEVEIPITSQFFWPDS